MPTTLLLPECLHIVLFFFSCRLSCNHFLRLLMARKGHSDLLFWHFNLFMSKIKVPSKTLQLFYYAFSIFFQDAYIVPCKMDWKVKKATFAMQKMADVTPTFKVINEESLHNLIGENITSVLRRYCSSSQSRPPSSLLGESSQHTVNHFPLTKFRVELKEPQFRSFISTVWLSKIFSNELKTFPELLTAVT